MTDRQIRFVIAYYHDGYYEREIAEQEGCSRPTVSVDLKKARQKLEDAGYPVPERLPRPEVNSFSNEMLNTLTKRAAGYYQWLQHERK